MKPFCASAHAAAAGEEGDAGEPAEPEVLAKQPKKKRPPKRTVEQNLSNLNSAESERKCEVDGYSFTRSTSSDPSTCGEADAGIWPFFPGGSHVPQDGLVL